MRENSSEAPPRWVEAHKFPCSGDEPSPTANASWNHYDGRHITVPFTVRGDKLRPITAWTTKRKYRRWVR